MPSANHGLDYAGCSLGDGSFDWVHGLPHDHRDFPNHPKYRRKMIRAKQVHRSYHLGKKEIEVLKGIDLEIKAGEKVFLCGPSGAGKTTLMYTLAGLESPKKGQVYIGEVDFYALSSANQARAAE